MQLSSSNQHWLETFISKHDRKPRILHIGNIANNAYLNAKLLNEVGIDCDVICYDYYHIMGCPEWEDANFSSSYGDQFKPEWWKAGIHDFERPRWFAQGPVQDCIDYLITKSGEKTLEADILWRKLELLNGTGLVQKDERQKLHLPWSLRLQQYFKKTIQAIKYLSLSNGISSRIAGSCDEGRISALSRSEAVRLLCAWGFISIALIMRLVSAPFKRLISNEQTTAFDERAAKLITSFGHVFPSRTNILSIHDVSTYRSNIKQWKRLFEHYDLVQAYATDPALPLLAEHPYVAFEHGTIRNIPYEDSSQGRLCALSYRLSDWTIVTNADNIESARRLKIPNFTFVPHPINEEKIVNPEISLREKLLSQIDASYLIFHPARQHWSDERHPDWEKGNDIFLIGFARFVHEIEKRAAIILVDWGASVQDSRALIERLGITNNVIWVSPMPHRRMVEYIQACDMVADQFFLGAFGSTLPKALACGRVSMLYLEPEMHRECFPEMPPVLNAQTPEEVFSQLSFAHGNKEEISILQESGKQWYQKYHSNQVIANKLTSVYSSILNKHSIH